MSMSYAPTKLRVPPGFEHLLEGLTREILRSQPKDIIAFSAEYFRKKIVLRDEEGIDEQKLPGHQDPQVAESGVGSGVSLSTPVAEEASHSVTDESTPAVPHEVGKERRSGLDISDPVLNKAATVIQSTFRGHLARERMKNLKDETEAPSEPGVTADVGGVIEDEQKEDEKKGRVSESGEEMGGEGSVEGDSSGGKKGGGEEGPAVEGDSEKVSKEEEEEEGGGESRVSVEGGNDSEGVESEAVHGEKMEDANEGERNVEPEADVPPLSEEVIKERESNAEELQHQGKETVGDQTTETGKQELSAEENTGGDNAMSTGAEHEGD